MNSEKNRVNPAFFVEIREMLRQARQKTYAAVNFVMVETYWQIGRRIVEEEQHGKERADYGSFLIRELSRSLTAEFGNGFALANLWNFRQFYLVFPDSEKLYTLCRELTWSHLRLIMRLENHKAREYYIQETAGQNWSVRNLSRNIQSHYFERLLGTATQTDLPKNLTAGKPLDPRDF